MIVRFSDWRRPRLPTLEFAVDKVRVSYGTAIGWLTGRVAFEAGIDQHEGEMVYYLYPPAVRRRCKRNRMEVEE